MNSYADLFVVYELISLYTSHYFAGPLLQPSLLLGPNRADRLMGLIEQYSLAFLDHTLKGHSNGLLSKALENADVSVRIFPPN